METSGFSDMQLEVREAITKICSKYPDVRIPEEWFDQTNAVKSH